jgi:hypothetical protein
MRGHYYGRMGLAIWGFKRAGGDDFGLAEAFYDG